MLNTFIYLNGKIFEIVKRDYEEYETGGQFERTLDATGTQDVGPIKRKWIFTFSVDSRQYSRLQSIKQLRSSVTLIDITGLSYTTKWTNSFKPELVGADVFTEWWNIIIELEEV